MYEDRVEQILKEGNVLIIEGKMLPLSVMIHKRESLMFLPCEKVP